MSEFFIFIVIGIVMLYLGDMTRAKGFNNLTIRRELETKRINCGDEFKITTIVENNKWLPISFLILNEYMPKNISYSSYYSSIDNGKNTVYVNHYTIGGHERVKRTYNARANKRGVYIISNIEVSIGDTFGFAYNNKQFEDYNELIVYPNVVNLNKFKFESIGLQGNVIVKRWIYEDPLFIKGVREYGPESRMKDIHWKASSKLGKLMVKEFDHTSDMEFTVILNVQCAEYYWQSIDKDIIEKEIELSVSIIAEIQGQKVPAGLCTNAMLAGISKSHKSEVKPSINSLQRVLELSARIGYDVRTKFSDYLSQISKSFSKNNTYIVITPYMDKEIQYVLSKLVKCGYSIKLIDMSRNGNCPSIRGVEKIVYKEAL
ncbi:DUF58 domain-containing protein [Clostridium hydrogenum]|uniref:DUF58 domain-containing protein n=1 Tax=Clostridium hydrogenum TaxID=2855764 RepID=UPI001F261036|nr:DUF58 domain-containing protein [Clostridium hydrogenum]